METSRLQEDENSLLQICLKEIQVKAQSIRCVLNSQMNITLSVLPECTQLKHAMHDKIEYLSSLLNRCTVLPVLHQIHAHLIRLSLHDNFSITSTLINLYSTLATPLDCLRLFSLATPSLFLFNTTIRVLCKQNPHASLLLYRQMVSLHVSPDNHTFPFLLISCSKLGALLRGSEVHGRIVKGGYFGFLHVSNALVDMYGKVGELGFARRLFSEMTVKDFVSYNVVFGAHARSGEDMDLARSLFDEMPVRSLISSNAMIVGFVRSGDLGAARAVFDEMDERNLVSWNSMLVGYTKIGLVEDARTLFDVMPERNLVSWAAMISGCAQNGRPNEALEVFREMEGVIKCVPDAATMIGVISSAAQLGSGDLANWVGSYVDRMGIERNERILTGLVDMHAKCGNVEKACHIFEEIKDNDVFSYTALINGLAAHGHGAKALDFFHRMQLEGIKPDRVTFIGVLNACRHSGLIKEGIRIWHWMVNCHKINPDSDHYACLIDMLGRAGKLNEAYELVRNMPSGQHVGALGAVLAACRTYGEVETAESIAKELFVLEPGNTGNYILLWSLYASKGEWDKAAKLRRLMNEKGITKLPAHSML